MIGRKVKALRALLVLALLATLFLVATPSSAGNQAWSQVNTPNVAGGNVLLPGSDVSVLAVAPDGLTMFAADNASATPGSVLYKSTDGGQTWTSTGVFQPGGAIPAGDAVPIVAIEISPGYALDGTVWVATRLNAWRSVNGGTSGGRVGAGVFQWPPLAATAVITSMDIAPNYPTSRAVLVGVADPTAATGGVFLFTEATLAWTDRTINNVAAGSAIVYPAAYAVSPGAGGGLDVAAVAFSPRFGTDGQINAVATDGFHTYVQAKQSTRAWAADILDARITDVIADVATPANPPASIAYPSDFDALNNNFLFVGVDAGAANTGDAYRITGRQAPFPSSLVKDMNVQGTATTTDISRVAFAGPAATGTLFAGWADYAAVYRSSNATATTPSWSANAGLKVPSGLGNTKVVVAPDYATSNTVHAGTSGAQSAVSRSTDGGATFNARSLVDTVLSSINDVALASGSTIIYLATSENGGAYGGIWRSTDGGATWLRVWLRAIPMALVALSPGYPADNVVFATEVGTTRIWKSSNAGNTWLGLTAQAPVNAWVVRGPDSLVTGTGGPTNQVYRTTNSGLTWSQATTPPGGAVNSLAVSLNIAADNTMIAGATNGAVYMSTDGGVNFVRVGTSGPASAAGNVYVAFDPDYASNKTIYAASAVPGEGVFRWIVGTSASWTSIDAPAGARMGGILVAPDGVLYAPNGVAGAGVRRSVNPAAPSPVFTTLNTGLSAGATLVGLSWLPGSNILYSRNTAANTVLTYTDFPDRVPPTTTLAVGSPHYIDSSGNSWVTSATPLTLTAVDADSGVSATYYRYYLSSMAPPSFSSGTSFNITGGDGQYTVEYYSVDNVGNAEAIHSQTERLDNTPPTSRVNLMVTYQLRVPFGVPYIARDAGSGVKRAELWYRYQPRSGAAWTGWTRYGDSPFLFSAPYGNGVYEFYTLAVDNLDNREAPPSVADVSVNVSVTSRTRHDGR